MGEIWTKPCRSCEAGEIKGTAAVGERLASCLSCGALHRVNFDSETVEVVK